MKDYLNFNKILVVNHTISIIKEIGKDLNQYQVKEKFFHNNILSKI